MRFRKFRDCVCGEPYDHHSQRKIRRCLHQDCGCMMYSPRPPTEKLKLIESLTNKIRGIFS